MACAFPPLLIWRGLRVRALRRRRIYTTVGHEALLMLFLLFLVGVASLTVLPLISWEGGPHIIPVQGTGGLNLLPFRVIKQTRYEVLVNGNFNYFLINFVGNIVMFLPIGFCIPLLWRLKPGWAVAVGAACSLFIELMQLRLARGTDVDDLILNTLGALLGMLSYLLFRKVAPKLCEACKMKP